MRNVLKWSMPALVASLLGAGGVAAQQLYLERYSYRFTVDLYGDYNGDDHGSLYYGNISGPELIVSDRQVDGNPFAPKSQDTLQIAREIKLVQDRNSKAILEIIADDNYRGVIIFDVRDEKVELSPGVLSFVPKISAAAWHGPHGQMKGSGHYYEEFLSQVAVIDSLPRILTLTFKEVDAASVDDQDPRAGAISDIGGVLRFGSWPETRNMEFYDLLGVRRYTAVINPDQIELSLPVDLMNGFYFVRLGSQSSKIAVVGR